MRKWIFVLLLALAIAVSAQAEPPAPGSMDVPITAVIAPKEGAALYQKPIETADAIIQIPQKTAVTVEALGLYWCRVTDGTNCGYVPATALHFDDWGMFDPESTAKENVPRLAVFNVGMSPAGHWTMTLREKENRKAAKMDTLTAGAVMVVLEKGKEYTLVHVGGKVGYVLTKYLSFHEAALPCENYAAVFGCEKVSFRYDRRFGDSGIITFLPSGTVVTLIWEKKGWACVESEGYQGYIVSEFLKISD